MRKSLFLMVVAAIFSTFANAQEGKMAKDSMKDGAKMFVSAEDAAKKALNVGAKMPSFTLNDSLGKSVNSADMLKQGHLVVVFYRGAWCPFCNTYLHKLQKNLSQIKENGGNLVAISVENADRSMAVAKKNELNFTVLSDPNLNVARSFGIVYQLSDETNEKYKGYGIDLVKYNQTEKPELPISATYVVSKKGEIVYAFVEPDYQKRAEPDAIMQALAKLKK
jgi:peroxiredoxin